MLFSLGDQPFYFAEQMSNADLSVEIWSSVFERDWYPNLF